MSRTASRPRAGRRAPTARPADLRRTFLVGAAIGGVVVVVLGTLILGGWWLVSRPDPVQRRADELRAADAVRDADHVVELTAIAREVREKIVPVIEGLDQAFDERAEDADVAARAASVEEAAMHFANPPSGSTEVNIARSSLSVSLEQLEVALATYEAGLEMPAGRRDAAVAAGARQLELAIRSWSVGATQLDWLNVEAGLGHQHVFLPTQADGALTADPAPEGEGNADHDQH